MPKKMYAMEPAGPKRVAVEWHGLWKDIRVSLDGAELGILANQKELSAGRDFTLADGSFLHVQLVRGFASAELQVTRNGVALPGSASDPAERVKQAAYMLYIIAALNVILGLVAAIGQVDFLLSIGAGWSSAVEGVVFAACGFGTMKRSRVALILGMVLFAVDGALVLASTVTNGGGGTGGIVARVLFFVPLVGGLKGMRDLRKQAQNPSQNQVHA